MTKKVRIQVNAANVHLTQANSRPDHEIPHVGRQEKNDHHEHVNAGGAFARYNHNQNGNAVRTQVRAGGFTSINHNQRGLAVSTTM